MARDLIAYLLIVTMGILLQATAAVTLVPRKQDGHAQEVQPQHLMYVMKYEETAKGSTAILPIETMATPLREMDVMLHVQWSQDISAQAARTQPQTYELRFEETARDTIPLLRTEMTEILLLVMVAIAPELKKLVGFAQVGQLWHLTYELKPVETERGSTLSLLIVTTAT